MRKAAPGIAVVRYGADLVEGIFGPDPGLLRLQMAGRSVFSLGVAVLVLVLSRNIGVMPMAGVALGFMVSLFASTMVRPAGICTEPLVGAVGRLEEALAALQRAIAATESDRFCRAR